MAKTKKVYRILLAEYAITRPFDANSAFNALGCSKDCIKYDSLEKILTFKDGRTISMVSSEDESRILIWLDIPETSEYTILYR